MMNVTLDPGRVAEKNEPLNEKEQTMYRKLIGQLNWAVQGSRPDMAYEMSTKLIQAKIGGPVRAIKKINQLKDIRSFMTFPKMDKTRELKIVVFTDASLGNINEGTGSTGAFII